MWGFLFKTYSYICCRVPLLGHTLGILMAQFFARDRFLLFCVCYKWEASFQWSCECSVDSLMVKWSFLPGLVNWWHPAPDWTLVGWIVSEFVFSFCQNQLNWASTQYTKAYKKPGCYLFSQRISTSLDLQWWFSTSSLDLLMLTFRCLSLYNLKRKSWLVCRLSQSEDSLFPTGIIHVSILYIWYFYILCIYKVFTVSVNV